MSCASLPDTGGPATVWLAAGLLCLVAGWLLVRRSGGGTPGARSLVVLAVIGAGCLVAQPSPGQAADDCEDPGARQGQRPRAVVIAQTSVIAGLTPGSGPDAIAGTVTNTALDSTYVTHVTVRISSVVKAAGSSAGACTAADYVLADARMPVNLPLPRLSSIAFSGASLGFRVRAHNQDACKGARIHLHYVSG
jgi:LPXTG-motif cell wall-anchored protein